MLLLLCGAACLAPYGWVSLPAAIVLLYWLPGRGLIALLRPVNAAAGRAWAAVALSLAVIPVGLHWFWQFSNNRYWLLGALAAVNLAVLMLAYLRGETNAPVPPLFDDRRYKWLLAAMVAWSAGMVFLCYWVPMAGGRILPNASGDYVKHHAILWSLVNYPLPLRNIFYAGEPTTPYYYYEHFYLMPAALCVLSGGSVSISAAFGIAAGLSAAAFIMVVFLLARAVLQSAPAATLATACVSVVGGWDVIPALIHSIAHRKPVIVLDSWCPTPWRIHNVINDLVWCPQHVAAVGVLVLACYLLQQAPRRGWWIWLVPLMAASILGSSVYQAMVIFPAAGVYALLTLRATGRASVLRSLGGLAVMGALGAALMWPLARQYREMSARFAGGLTLEWDRFDYAVLGRLVPAGWWANLLDAPWMLLIDFGLGFVACVLINKAAWRRLWGDPGVKLLMLAGGLGVALMWVVRSNISSIEYSFRLAAIPAQVVAAVAIGCLLMPEMVRPIARNWTRRFLIAGVLLGLPAGLYEAPGLGLRTLVERRTEAAEARALRCMRYQLPADAVVQGAPDRTRLPQLIDRQMGVMAPDPHVNVLSPRDRARMLRAVRDVREAFGSESGQAAHELLAAWHVTHVLVGIPERARLSGPGPFGDPSWFQAVYDDGKVAVYRLIALSANSRPSEE